MAHGKGDMGAAIYCRISRDAEGTRLGVEQQEQDCRKLCARNGWTVFGVFTDNDISASKGKKREQFNRMVDTIGFQEDHSCGCVLTVTHQS